MGACLLLFVAFMLTLLTLRRHDFVAFYPLPLPERTAQRLTPKQKIPVHTTGLFMVENKNTPGYRAFIALLPPVNGRCFVRCRIEISWHISHWPETDIWYVFFMPEAVQQIRWGQLRFGRTIGPAIAITYQITAGRDEKAAPMRTKRQFISRCKIWKKVT